jgi:hypothetical protein
MKSTVSTLLCMGMVAASWRDLLPFGSKAAPETPKSNIQMLDCHQGLCSPKVYAGTWKAILAKPTLMAQTGCSSLFYQVTVFDAKKPIKGVPLNPDHYRKGIITEACGDQKKSLEADGEPKLKFLGFRAPLSSTIRGYLQIEKVWILESKIVAAAVQHPLFIPYATITTRSVELVHDLVSTKSLWVNVENYRALSQAGKADFENSKERLLAIAAIRELRT